MNKNDIPISRQELRYSIAIHMIEKIVSEYTEQTTLLIYVLQAVYDCTQLLGDGAKVNTGQIKTSCAKTHSIIFDLDQMEIGLRILNRLGLIERVGLVVAICQAGKEVMEVIYILAEQRPEFQPFIRPHSIGGTPSKKSPSVKLHIVKP